MGTENERFKKVRKHLNLSQSELAMKLNIKQGSLSDIERGKDGVGVSANIKMKLNTLYNVNIDYIEKGSLPMILDVTNDPTQRYLSTGEVYLDKYDVKIPINELVDHFVNNKDLYLESSEYLKLWLESKIEDGVSERLKEMGLKIKYVSEN